MLFWPPGDHFDYSNLGYGVLGEVIARSSGQTLASYLLRHVFQPLGMADSFLDSTPELDKITAAQYDSTSHERSPKQVSDTPGASSIHSSIHDLAIFGMFALKDYLPTQEKFLSTSDIDLMVNPVVKTDDGEQYGLGWWVLPDFYGYRSIMAQGGTNDSFAVLQLIPSEQIAIAVLANTGTTVPSTIVEEVLSDLLPHFAEERRKRNSQHKPTPVQSSGSPRPLGEWAGSVMTWKGPVPVRLDIRPDTIEAQIASQTPVQLSDVRMKQSYIYGVARGDLGTPDAARPPYDIQIEVYLRNGKLTGAATAVPRPDEDGPELPYWVSLNRVR